MAPFVPHTHATAAICMKQIVHENQSRTIRRLRAKLATERRDSVATKEGLENKISSLERELQLQRCGNQSLQNMVTMYHKDIDHRISQWVEAKKEHKSNQVTFEASHTTISGLTEIGLCMSKKIERMRQRNNRLERAIWSAIKSGRLISNRPKDNGDPFVDELEEESEEDPKEEELEEIPISEGEIVDE
ncbi:hypothetical protein F511_16921 [Dorcoceras hygrometricum]|uniref:Uncharacterized protein n=1 Tax=Dorcoceras hygrometricum TaxID=472368 RepID=A0A2Z7AY08_9LAMI|nr:hypothetical protein F511_16921 [Dorcoceras hygrometricum]